MFLGYHEAKWMNENSFNKPRFYLKHIDDILAAFGKEINSLDFLNFLQKKNRNIKFTTEKQVNHSILFLGGFISGIDSKNITLQTYQKSSNTELIKNFQYFRMYSNKIVFIRCLIKTSSKICKKWNSFHNDVEKIKADFTKSAHSVFKLTKH